MAKPPKMIEDYLVERSYARPKHRWVDVESGIYSRENSKTQEARAKEAARKRERRKNPEYRVKKAARDRARREDPAVRERRNVQARARHRERYSDFRAPRGFEYLYILRVSEPTVVYFKLGRSVCVEGRMKQMQGGNPRTIYLVRKILVEQPASTLETDLLHRFREFSVAGGTEWFQFPNDDPAMVIEAMDRLAVDPDKKEKTDGEWTHFIEYINRDGPSKFIVNGKRVQTMTKSDIYGGENGQ